MHGRHHGGDALLPGLRDCDSRGGPGRGRRDPIRSGAEKDHGNTADGREQLAQRRHFDPLPRRGHYYRGESAQYTLEDLRDGARHRLREFVVQRFGAQPLPLGPYQDGRFISASLRGQTVVFSDQSVHVEVRQREAAHALIHEIGDTLDAELAAGRLQDLFE